MIRADYIESSSLRDPVPLWRRPYGALYAPVYAILLNKYLTDYDNFFGISEWTFLYFGGAMFLHAVLFLLPFWNINLKEMFETRAASDPRTATLIKIVPKRGSGKAEFATIEVKDGVRGFVFQQRRFLFDEKLNCFRPPNFWIDSLESKTIGELLNTTGLSGNLDQDHQEYGKNIFDIPVPTFSELWKEHAVAPFFVFQIFSCCLWFLDEMWKTSVFMLFMLVAFESTVVMQRQRTMAEFRQMGVKPYELQCFRNKKWQTMNSADLLPGDLVSIQRSKEGGLACDFVLLSGTCVVNEAMLSGESTPLLKESIADRDINAKFDGLEIDKISVLAGGTEAIQVSAGESKQTGKTPDGGALGLVARTGFETSQGQLVRTMIFSAERIGSGSKEAYFFILFLMVFAVAASYYVWVEGQLIGRKQSKLLLDCVLIVTSVVPPELPVELTLAVNASLSALSKHFIYCTEPFRIPFAGRVDVCCFDKTGTLTEENLNVDGVDFGTGLKDLKALEGDSILAVAGAHALVKLDDGEVVGDPMERTTLQHLGWDVDFKDTVRCGKESLRITKRFAFSSALKRSSTVLKAKNGFLVAVKGAPETIDKMLKDKIDGYEEIFKRYTINGSRVLAYAYKHVRNDDLTREQAESDLTFAGFLVYTSPLKSDAVSAIQMLNESSHRSVMITGDNPLTAVKVARDVAITYRDAAILDMNGSVRNWIFPTDSKVLDFASNGFKQMFKTYDLCITGAALNSLDPAELAEAVNYTWVYARVSPSQKELLLQTLKDQNYITLMCGDGTNDVGALKQAHIGVALLNGTAESMVKLQDQAKIDNLQKIYEKQRDMVVKWSGREPPVPEPIAHLYPPSAHNPHYVKTVEKRGGKLSDEQKREIAVIMASSATQTVAEDKAANMADKVSEMLQDDSEEIQLKLGDASCAAPLTSKLRDVDAVVKIIRQGRCTLVTTIQMYKILALNCLISAYTLSVLFLAGIKLGDGQSIASGLLLSMCSMSVSRGRVREKLSRERPQPGIFNFYIMGSVLGQFLVHVIALILVRQWVYYYEPPVRVDLDKKFEPSLLNTAMYLLQIVQEISTYAVNYQGHPFRESLSENKGMYYGILGSMALAFAGATEMLPELNENLSLVPIPTPFKIRLVITMLADLALCYGIENGLKALFSDFKPREIAYRKN